MFTRNCRGGCLAHLFVLAPLSETSERVGTMRPLGHVAGGLAAIRGVCRAWQAFYTFGHGHTQGRSSDFRNIPRDGVSASPRGFGFPIPPWTGFRIPPVIGLPHPLSPCTNVRLDANQAFLLVEGTRTFPYFDTEHRDTILPPSRSTGP